MEDGYGRGASSVQCRYVESKIDQHAVAYYIFIFIYYRYITFIYIYYIYIYLVPITCMLYGRNGKLMLSALRLRS